MMQDILGKILDAKKGQAMTITINVEPEHETEDDAMEKQGMAPVLEKEGANEMENEGEKEMNGDKAALMNGEEDEIALKKKRGIPPRGLADRAKMMMMDK